MKRELRKQGKYLQMDPNNFELKVVFHGLKKEYNKTLKMTKRNFYKQIILQLDTLHENDPKSFWRTVDQLTLYHKTKFLTLPNQKHLQMTNKHC